MTAFDDDTALERVAEDVYRGRVDRRWWVVRGPHGGYLAAMILSALTSAVDDPARSPRSFSTHFVSAPAEGSVDIHVAIERTGSSMTFCSARAYQDGRVVALSLATFSVPWSGFGFDDARAPEAVPVQDSFPVPTDGDSIPPFLANFDMRWALGDPPFTGSQEAVVGGWIRLAEPQIADAIVVAALMDAWPPAVFPRATRPVVAPTIDLTVHFRSALPAEGAGSDDFYLGRFTSILGRDGFFEEDGVLFDTRGRLVAQSRQLALALTP